MKSSIPYLEHIIDSISAIEEYTAEGRQNFLDRRLIRDAVIRNFEIIGEAAGRLSPEIHARSDIPWRRIIAFRNRLIHGYWSIDPFIIWDVVENDLPTLKYIAEKLLAEARGGDGNLL